MPAAGSGGPGLRAAAGLVALGLLAGGCATARAQQGPDERGGATGATGAAGSSGPSAGADGPGPSDSPDPALAGRPTPTLPPGDPGTGDPQPDVDPDGDPESHPDGDTAEHGDETAGGVAEGALLDAGTVASVAGGSWTATATPSGCTTDAPVGSAAARRLALVAVGGALTQTVAAYRDQETAGAGVIGTGDRLADCGFTVTGDPRLGEASVELSSPESGERAMVLAADGALVLLVASGSAAAPGAWESLVDLALGTSCAAAPHGCH